MKRLLILLMAGFPVTPALGQHEGHEMPEPTPEAPAAAAAQGPAEAAAADPHAGHVMPQAEPAAEADPHAGHVMPQAETPTEPDPHAGHVTPAMDTEAQGASTAGHDMSGMDGATSAPPEAPPPPEAFSGPSHAADTLFDPVVMAAARENLRAENGDFRSWWVMADQWETRISDGEEEYLWDAQGWYGGDLNKLWVKTEGEGGFGESPEELELQALWSRAILPWWDFQVGVRHDFRPGPERTHLVVGLQGLMPYQFEVDAAAFISDDGDLSARFEAEYDQRITQRLILQPRLEFELAGQAVSELGIGSGLNSGELGLRLRYEFTREFAPYVGVEYERYFGDTADSARAAGEERSGWNFLLGVRIWF